MKTEKYDDKWSIATNDKGEKFWIDNDNKKDYSESYKFNPGPARKEKRNERSETVVNKD